MEVSMLESNHVKEIALFRFQIISPLLTLSGPRGTLKREMARIAERTHDHPVRGLIRIGPGTIEEWLYIYKREGFDGLLPAGREDRGKSRAIDENLAEKIEVLAKGRPDLDGRGILSEIKGQIKDGGKIPSLSTLYRFLRARGLDQRRAPPRQDHRAFAFDLAGDCWQGDVMYGPSIPALDGTRRKTYLIAILDDATRVIAHAQFYLAEHLRSLKDCLKQALLKRGLPRRLYFDNGKIFRSRMILQLCARLGVHLIHTRPYRPQGRAKLERWFLTVRRSFLPRVDLDRLDGLDALNRLLFAWIEGEYHVSAHRGLGGETPLDRWVKLSESIRALPRDVDLDELFLEETSRRVAKDGTISLHGKIFEVGPSWIGLRVTAHYDPFDLRKVLIITARKDRLEAFPVDLSGNRRVRRNPPVEHSAPPPPLRSLDDLADEIDGESHPGKEVNSDE
jgi:transposase InsO family protein